MKTELYMMILDHMSHYLPHDPCSFRNVSSSDILHDPSVEVRHGDAAEQGEHLPAGGAAGADQGAGEVVGADLLVRLDAKRENII